MTTSFCGYVPDPNVASVWFCWFHSPEPGGRPEPFRPASVMNFLFALGPSLTGDDVIGLTPGASGSGTRCSPRGTSSYQGRARCLCSLSQLSLPTNEDRGQQGQCVPAIPERKDEIMDPAHTHTHTCRCSECECYSIKH